MKLKITDIRSSWEGFSQLSRLALDLQSCFLDEVEIDMSAVGWFDANMCAPFGAILYRTSLAANDVTITAIQCEVQKILSKNGFLANYGYPLALDTYGTTIPYKRFELGQERHSASYVDMHLSGKGMPQMTRGLRTKLLEAVLEIFSNSFTHSETELGVFSCGQFFPKRDRLDFSIADLGMGIRKNILQKRHVDLSAENAIKWAISERNTTREGPVPGGSGLKILREFISMNRGRMQIVSDKGYMEFGSGFGTPLLRLMDHPFPGTVVNLEFNTADTNSYCLASEVGPEDTL